MAAKKKVTVEVDAALFKKLLEAAQALSELAAANMTGVDDPAVRSLGKKTKTKGRAK